MALWFWKQPWQVLCPLWSVHHLREARQRQAAGVVSLVCFRTVDSCPDPAVIIIYIYTLFHLSKLLQFFTCLHEAFASFSCATVSPSSASSEPSCDVISKAQKLQAEAERSWALSQVCAYYQHRCPPTEVNTESCIRIMGESCSARVLQCSLLNTMQNLEPATQTQAQGERTHA